MITQAMGRTAGLSAQIKASGHYSPHCGHSQFKKEEEEEEANFILESP